MGRLTPKCILSPACTDCLQYVGRILQIFSMLIQKSIVVVETKGWLERLYVGCDCQPCSSPLCRRASPILCRSSPLLSSAEAEPPGNGNSPSWGSSRLPACLPSRPLAHLSVVSWSLWAGRSENEVGRRERLEGGCTWEA